MGRAIISFEHAGERWFAVWSSVVDAPLTCALTEPELREWFTWQYGAQGASGWAAAVWLAKEFGTSDRRDDGAQETAALNRAGRGETQLTWEQLVEQMVRQREEASFQFDGVAWSDLCSACGEEMAGKRREDPWGDVYHPRCL